MKENIRDLCKISRNLSTETELQAVGKGALDLLSCLSLLDKLFGCDSVAWLSVFEFYLATMWLWWMMVARQALVGDSAPGKYEIVKTQLRSFLDAVMITRWALTWQKFQRLPLRRLVQVPAVDHAKTSATTKGFPWWWRANYGCQQLREQTPGGNLQVKFALGSCKEYLVILLHKNALDIDKYNLH